jgi:hypothetical protein
VRAKESKASLVRSTVVMGNGAIAAASRRAAWSRHGSPFSAVLRTRRSRSGELMRLKTAGCASL